MQHLAPLIYDLAIMLGLASLVTLLFQRIKQPVVLGYLVAGVIVGPYTPPYALVNDVANIKILSELGVIFLMFSLGLEFSFHKLTRVGLSASVTGSIEVVLMMLVGYLYGSLINWSFYDSLFLGAALAISSTTIIIKAIDELKLKTKRFAELIFGILIVEDLLAILLLVALSTVVITKNVFSFDMIEAVIKLVLVVGGWFIVGYFIVPTLFRKIATYMSQETLTIISVALCLILSCTAASFNYSSALGAFIMGSILAETTLVHRIEELIMPIRDIFAAVFFISVGMLIDPKIIVQYWPVVLGISLVTIVGKVLTTSLAALFTGQSFNTSIRVGFGMAQVGEFSFIIVALGLSLKVLSAKVFPIIVAVSGITTFTTPYLINFSDKFAKWLEASLPEHTKVVLQNYSTWVYRSQARASNSHELSTAMVRIAINGIVIAIIFTLVHYFAFHRFEFFSESSSLANSLFLLLSLVISSPFIWGMLFSYEHLTKTNVRKINIVNFITWFITVTEVVVLSVLYFNTWFTITLLFIIACIFLVLLYKRFEKSYQWLEKQLVKNISGAKHKKEKNYRELAPWDTHLVEIEVGDKSSFADKTLSECEFREKFGINIVAIGHLDNVIIAPRGNEKILARDKLIVLGQDEQIDQIRKKLEIFSRNKLPTSLLSNFRLVPILINPRNALIGKSIRDSKVREKVNGIVVGLERSGLRTLNPTTDTILRADDLLLVVGEAEKIKNWKLRSV